MTTYSDNGVDTLVQSIFDGFIGHACDVGANNGVFNSNTLALEEAGWTVLCVEPNPLLAPDGRKARKLWREVACGEADADDADFSLYETGPHYASSSGLGVRGRGDCGLPRSIVKVRVRTLDRVLEEAGFPKLDYLTVDVEGWEREVMAGFTAERWKPRVIVLEDWNNDPAGRLIIPGYSFVSRAMFDNVYRRDF